MTRKLRVGIVGASGWMAGALATGIEYDSNDGGESRGNKNPLSVVTGLCDLNLEAIRRRKEELQLDQAECFASYSDLLASDSVDAVVVAVPNHLHVPFAIEALESGKHLFLEKPYATSWEDSQKLTKAVRGSRKTTKLDYILVHYDEQERLRNLILEGAFGHIASTHFTYRHPIQVSESAEQIWKLAKDKSGGAIPMGICHALSMTQFQVGALPETVVCKSSPAKVRDFDYPTQMDILICFDNGVVSLVQGNIDFAEKYDARHTVIGTHGQFDYTPYNPTESRVMWSSQIRGREYGPDPEFARHHLDSGDVWKHQCSRTIQDFVEHALRDEKDPLLGLESPLVQRTEAVIWAAEHSAAHGSQPVRVADFLAWDEHPIQDS
jgi:predicted dehydrogenase